MKTPQMGSVGRGRGPHLVSLAPDHPGFSDHVYRERRDTIASLALEHNRNYEVGDAPPRVAYTREEERVWREVCASLDELHRRHACAEYLELAARLGLNNERIPQLAEVDAGLAALGSGFRLRPVAGLVSGRDFLAQLGHGTFLCTQYMRHPSRPLYTPEPDVIHELIGHAATLAGEPFAGLNRLLGTAALRARTDEELQAIDRLYWFTLEFGLIEEHGEPKAFGAGLLSSAGELASFSGAELVPFEAERIVETSYDPTDLQEVLFVASDWGSLQRELEVHLSSGPL